MNVYAHVFMCTPAHTHTHTQSRSKSEGCWVLEVGASNRKVQMARILHSSAETCLVGAGTDMAWIVTWWPGPAWGL